MGTAPNQTTSPSMIVIATLGLTVAAALLWAVDQNDKQEATNPKYRSNAKEYSGWAIVNSSNQMLVIDHRGNEKWKNIPKNGIASGAFTYGSEQEANYQIGWMNESGHWPLMNMKPRLFTWK